MTSQAQGFQDFALFAARLKGDEKSEAQRFLLHFQIALEINRAILSSPVFRTPASTPLAAQMKRPFSSQISRKLRDLLVYFCFPFSSRKP